MPKIPHARKCADMSRVQLFSVATSGSLVPTKLHFGSTTRERTDAQRLAFACTCPAVVPSTGSSLRDPEFSSCIKDAD